MSDDRPRDPDAPDGPASSDRPASSDPTSSSPFSLRKGDPDGVGAGGVTYGYGAPTYGSSPTSTAGNSYDANQAQGPTTDAPATPTYDPNSGYAPPGSSGGYDAGSGYAAPSSGYAAPSSGYAAPSGGYAAPSGGYDASGGYPAPTGYGSGAAVGTGPSPYGAPSPGGAYGTPPPKKKKTGLVIGLVAGVLVVLLIGIGGIVLLASSGGDDSKPAATVQAYLQALADGNAAEALKQGAQPPDTSFVTDAALKSQQEIAKISAISVSEGYSTNSSARVSATYTFGDQQADESFSLTKISGEWKLDDTTYPIDLTSLDDVPGLTLFGVDASGKDKVYVFPGPLTWGSSNKYFTVAERNADEFTLSPSDGSYSYSTLETSLSDDGEQAVADAVTKYITDCAAAKDLTPDNCPQAEYDYSAVDGTATWTPPSDLSSLEYQTSSPVTEVYVSGDLTWSVSYTSQDFNGAQTPVTKNDVDGSIYGTVDLSQDPPVFTD